MRWKDGNTPVKLPQKGNSKCLNCGTVGHIIKDCPYTKCRKARNRRAEPKEEAPKLVARVPCLAPTGPEGSTKESKGVANVVDLTGTRIDSGADITVIRPIR